ncbi:MAG: acetoacetate--CoA ligase [Thermoplasmata archaeon]
MENSHYKVIKMEAKLLWKPEEEQIKNSNMFKYIEFLSKNYNRNFKNYGELYEWSINNMEKFWQSIWDFAEIIHSEKYKMVVDDIKKFPGAKWFVGAKLNFAQNILKYRNEKTAIIFRSEPWTEERRQITYNELNNIVSRLQNALKNEGIGPGDKVAAYMPNIPETVISMLSSTSLGATWSSSGTELGPKVILDRFTQIQPKILFTVDSYYYKGKKIDLLENVKNIANGLKSLKKIVIYKYAGNKNDIKIPNAEYFEDFISGFKSREIEFEQLPSDHPLYVMFSSGTTGKPKSMVQSAVGVLINQLKELILHTDLKKDDTITYITSPSWMMWNWLMSSFATGATVFLFDGNPLYSDWMTMWKYVEKENITILGCSASYIYSLKNLNAAPSEIFDLSSLREISQTGSSLSPEGFEWVYSKIKKDIHFNSISGGTDINGCFGIGSPILPVYAGEIQSPGLGMKIKAYDEEGNPVLDKVGELVCEAPTPSMPLYFLNDPGNKRYFDTYFSFYYPKKNVWRHGDFVFFDSKTGGIIFMGRSDATLKPSGVRIGTAEIYNIVENLPEIADSAVVGQEWKGDQRIILFVKLKKGYLMNDELKGKIKNELRRNASPRHVPDLIIEVPDIPYTFNQKKVEIAISNIVNGKPVTNMDTIVNPESLEYIIKILPLINSS